MKGYAQQLEASHSVMQHASESMPYWEQARVLSKKLESREKSREYRRLMEREVMLETTAESFDSLTPRKTNKMWDQRSPDQDPNRSWDRFHDLLQNNSGERARTTKKPQDDCI